MSDEVIVQEEQENNELIVPSNNLYLEATDIVNKIIEEQDSSKLEELTKLFTLNQRKKDIARINKLSQLLNLVDDEVTNRLIDAPEDFDNDQLINYMSKTQQAMSAIESSLDQKPLIQINNQKNEVNINGSGLNRESRAKVLETVMAILNGGAEDIIDIEEEKNN